MQQSALLLCVGFVVVVDDVEERKGHWDEMNDGCWTVNHGTAAGRQRLSPIQHWTCWSCHNYAARKVCTSNQRHRLSRLKFEEIHRNPGSRCKEAVKLQAFLNQPNIYVIANYINL